MTFEVEKEVMRRQPDYPPEQSMSGNNSYAMMCEHIGYRTGYCVCLHKINAFSIDKTRLNPYPACEKAIRSTACPAISMKKEEAEAGKTLFYVDRLLLREAMDKHFEEASAARKSDFFSAQMPDKRKKPTPPAATTAGTSRVQEKVSNDLVQSNSEENGYAAAINAAIREIPKEEPVKVAAPVAAPVTEKKGLSLLEMARLQMAAKAKQQSTQRISHE